MTETERRGSLAGQGKRFWCSYKGRGADKGRGALGIADKGRGSLGVADKGRGANKGRGAYKGRGSLAGQSNLVGDYKKIKNGNR
ncbi:hypothetical protein U1Q18_024812 [Sarracenia purpurea var. burkii]